jgi:DNA-binding transcriptional ArsR family regulator
MARRSRKQIVLTDPRSIRALSHPARLAAIDELYSGRVATSTELAELTGLTPSAMSYHLRAMEKLGIVERDDSATDARERPWRAAGKGLSVSEFSTTAQVAAASLIFGSVFDNQRKTLESYLQAEADLPDDWRGNGNFDSGMLYLTADETRQLVDALQEAIKPFRAKAARRRKGTRRIRTGIYIVPDVR